jgi:two-component system NtrC family sensor kinase
MSLEKRIVLVLSAVLMCGCVAYGLTAHHYIAELSERLNPDDVSLLRSLVWTGVIVTVGLVAIVGSIAIGVGHVALWGPIRQLSLMAAEVGAGNFDRRSHFVRRDEIGRLGLAMDAMCDQLRAARLAAEDHVSALEQLRHSDRVSTLGRLASSVAHELGNPLNVIEMRAQLIEAGDTATLSEAQQNAAIIRAQARRMTRIIQDILSFARRQPARITRCDLAATVRDAIALCEHSAKKRRTLLQFDAPSKAIEIDADDGKLLQVIVNLVLNAVQATPEGGAVSVELQDRLCAPLHDEDAPKQRYACIAVIDHGEGIPTERLVRIFEPFFSTRGPGEGTGLGLSVAQGIAKEHDGWIAVESELGQGSAFSVFLPR